MYSGSSTAAQSRRSSRAVPQRQWFTAFSFTQHQQLLLLLRKHYKSTWVWIFETVNTIVTSLNQHRRTQRSPCFQHPTGLSLRQNWSTSVLKEHILFFSSTNITPLTRQTSRYLCTSFVSFVKKKFVAAERIFILAKKQINMIIM